MTRGVGRLAARGAARSGRRLRPLPRAVREPRGSAGYSARGGRAELLRPRQPRCSGTALPGPPARRAAGRAAALGQFIPLS